MTMNGLEIDPDSQQFKRKMLNLSTYPATLIHETLEVVGSVYKKYIVDNVEDDRDQSRNSTCIFDELEQLQYAMIVMQNLLFARRQEINKQIKQSTSTLVTTRRQAIAMKETLQLNLAMLERAECKVTRFSDQEMVTIIIKNYCDLMREVEFPNTTEKIYFWNFWYRSAETRRMVLMLISTVSSARL